MNGPRITIYRDRAGEYRWRLQAANSRIVADSAEGYTRQRNAVRAAERTIWLMAEAVVQE